MVIDPTCGVGNFVDAASRLFRAKKIIRVEVNQQYIQEIKAKDLLIKDERIQLQQANFFEFNWSSFINQLDGDVLVLGNFP
ncbi:MAG: hypothetical protein KME18_13675 [Phormidium tanganyikae FI6-MK23]|nr:hypothetical protein [Phormidium tanganyikae FI6-MK23]